MVDVVAAMDFPDGIPPEIAGAEYWVQIVNTNPGSHYPDRYGFANLKAVAAAAAPQDRLDVPRQKTNLLKSISHVFDEAEIL